MREIAQDVHSDLAAWTKGKEKWLMWSARHYWFTVDATNQLSRTTDHAPFIGTLGCDGGLGQPFTPNPVPKGTVSATWIPLVKGTQGRSL